MKITPPVHRIVNTWYITSFGFSINSEIKYLFYSRKGGKGSQNQTANKR